MVDDAVPTTLDKVHFLRGYRQPHRLGHLAAAGRAGTAALDVIAAALERLHLIRILGAFALVVGGPAFVIDLLDRTEERSVRAWQLIVTPAPGNSGKREALEYLNSQPWYWPLKTRVRLGGADLSADRHNGRVDLAGVDLRHAQAAWTNFSEAVLVDAQLDDADLEHANLSGALLWGADFSGANLWSTHVSGARFNFDGASTATGLTKDQIGAAWAWRDMPPLGLPVGLSPRFCSPEDRVRNVASWRNVKPNTC
ncbi:MAG: pentapeptide repeat-containing protein [Kiloniellales bacterium]|nr:pentapeptide repeat-containing protein [Kiloniellales bacterium]